MARLRVMSGPPLTMQELVEELLADARKLVRYGEEAQQALADHDAQSACNTLDLARYPLSQVEDALGNILKQFELDGVTPRLR